MSRIRRRLSRDSTAIAYWERNRDWYMSRSQPGERPVQWWKYESDRPDLAGGTDSYAHLFMTEPSVDGVVVNLSPDNPKLQRARERLRHLLHSGELRADEVAEIHRRAKNRAVGWRWQWRSDLLREEGRG